MKSQNVIDGLIASLKLAGGEENRNKRAVMVQAYIHQYGPIPNERGKEVRALLVGEEDESKQLDFAIKNADGTVNIIVKGRETEVHGDCNRPALLLAAHAIIIAVAQKGTGSFEDAIQIISDLHDCMNSEIVN